MMKWTRVACLALLSLAVALPSEAVLLCAYVCNQGVPCCSQRCWDAGWSTCGEQGYYCNSGCRAEPDDDSVDAREAALLRALLPATCSDAPSAPEPVAGS